MNLSKNDYDFASLIDKVVEIDTDQVDSQGVKFPVKFVGIVAECDCPNDMVVLQSLRVRRVYPHPKGSYPHDRCVEIKSIKSIKVFTIFSEVKFYEPINNNNQTRSDERTACGNNGSISN